MLTRTLKIILTYHQREPVTPVSFVLLHPILYEFFQLSRLLNTASVMRVPPL